MMGAVSVTYSSCAGLDIHKKTVVACVITPELEEIRTFGTMTKDLLALSDWLRQQGVTDVAMESTGVYWQPVWNILEDSFELLLVNAQHIKAVPGRKTDVKDCEWIADLLRHGLLRPSFVPDRPARELRELTRYRSSLVHERTSEVNRLHKTLEGANIKLTSVVSEVTGVSARRLLAALLNCEAPQVEKLVHSRLRDKVPQLERALAGRFGSHQRFMVARQLRHIDDLDQLIEETSAEIAERLRPFDEEIALL